MNYITFRNKTQNWPIIFSRDVLLREQDKQVIRNQIERWYSKKLLIKLRRGEYLLNKNDRKINPSRLYISNQLYAPSYVSMEYALNYYGLIPERVSDLTSITTRKTKRFSNELGAFVYQHVKPDVFRGFKTFQDEAGLNFLIAEPEKAVVDFLYFNLAKFQKDYEKVFEESYRLQNTEVLNAEKIIGFAKIFKNKKLLRVAWSFCGFIKKEGKND